MQYIRPEVTTLCIGQAASMGSLLLCGGAAGKRFSLPNSRIMVNPPSGGFQGQATEIENHAKEILLVRVTLNEIYSSHSGQKVKDIADALERDRFYTAVEAKDFGLIDEVVSVRPEGSLDDDNKED